MNWINENIIDINKHQAFVYEIHNIKLNLRYIGKKNIWSTTSKPPLKGRVNRRKTTKESNWKTYFSSSDTVKQWNIQDCKCTILIPCELKGQATFHEIRLLWLNDVLNPDNNFVNKAIGNFRRFYTH